VRIVLFDFFFEPGQPGRSGLSDLVWSWAEHLVTLGDEVHIVAPYPEHSQLPAGVLVHRFPVPPIGYRNILGHVLIALRGWQEVRRIARPAVVHAPEYLSTGVFSFLPATWPLVLTTPGNIFERINNVNHADWITTQVYKAAALASARRCACIIATSAEMAKWWQFSGADPSKIVQIPLGVDTSRFDRVPRAKAQLGWTRPAVLFAGRLQAENGAANVIRAMALVAKRVPNAMLHMVGTGPDEPMLRRLAASLGLSAMIQWHGRVPLSDLPAMYSAADVFVLPRLSRVTPRALLEAMACGSPVVTSALGGMAEFVEDGRTGWAVDPRSPTVIADRVVDVLENPGLTASIGAAARCFVRDELAWPVIVGRVRNEVYGRLVR
jgi:glycosyltransferase involved in cell wall biosynthesis